MALISFLLVGVVAGWLAGLIMDGGGFGVLRNIVIGVAGAVIGGYLFNLLGIYAGGGLLGSLVTAVAGAVILLFFVRLVKKS